MPNYFLRIELHNDQQPNDYDKLHEKLFEVGFYRAIADDDGKWYDLPHGTYYGSSTSTMEAIRTQAGTITNAIFTDNPGSETKPKSASILVIQSEDVAWSLFSPADKNRIPK